MSRSFAKTLPVVISVTVVLASAGCVPCLSSDTVVHDRGTKWAPVALLGAIDDRTNRVPCHGSVEVYRNHGTYHLFGAEGPWWGRRSFYGVYFKEGIDAPGEFYLLVSPDRKPVRTYGVTGQVIVQGREVLINAEYKDGDGRWKKLPVNGRHKIDRVYPDDRAYPEHRLQTQ